jgi:hypothetical protein
MDVTAPRSVVDTTLARGVFRRRSRGEDDDGRGAHDFRRAVATELAPATTAKVTMIARQNFADAVNRELITKKPFVGVKPRT